LERGEEREIFEKGKRRKGEEVEWCIL